MRSPFHLTLILLLFAHVTPDVDAQRRRRGGPRFRKTKLVERFDKNKSGRLEDEERAAARAYIAKERGSNPRRRFRGGSQPTNLLKPYRVAKESVKTYPQKSLYDLSVVRTFFLEFKAKDWAKELDTFYRTDVEVPATLTVDGKAYKEVGVHFRGSSSYFTVANRKKKSFAIAMDFVHKKQRLQGYKTLNLLSGHADPTFMRTVLFSHIANHYVPVPKACFIHLVVNGESWGLYVNDQQLNKDFLKEAFGTRRGSRWKIPPNFNGEASLTYLGDKPKAYQTRYVLKSGKAKKSWKELIRICKTLEKSSPDKLARSLPKLLDIERTLWFLAIDNVFMDGDGYHARGSDYALYLHPDGRFVPLFRDNNEAFKYSGGPGGFHGRRFGPPRGRGGRGGRSQGPKRDLLALIKEPRAPLVSKVLAVPAWRKKYLENCRTLVTTWLDWQKIQPLVRAWKTQIEPIVAKDDKALYGYRAFLDGLGKGGGRSPGLKQFIDARRSFLLSSAALKDLK